MLDAVHCPAVKMCSRRVVQLLSVLVAVVDCRPPGLETAAPIEPDPITDMRYVLACNHTSPVSLSAVNEVLVHKRLGPGEEHRFQCFLHCLFTKYGWMDEEGGFLEVEMRRVLSESLAEEPQLMRALMYECTEMPSDADRCRRALLFTRCFWQRLDHPDLEPNPGSNLYYEHWP